MGDRPLPESAACALRACWLLLAVLAALAGAGAVAGCQRESSAELVQKLSDSIQRSEPQQAPLYVVQRGTVTRKIQFSGSVAPVNEEKLYFRVGGRIRALYVEQEAWVSAGTILAELEMSDLSSRVAEAQVGLETVRRRVSPVAGNERAIAAARARLRIAELRLEQARAQDPADEVTIAEANLAKVAAALEAARVTGQLLRDAELDHQIAEATRQRARRNRDSYLLGLQVLEAEVELARIDLAEAQLVQDDGAESDVRLAEISLKRLQDQAEMNRIRAPVDGQVMSISKLAGSEVAAYEPIVVVGDPSNLEVVADLPRTDVIQLHVDQGVEVELSDYPGRTIAGTIRRLPYVGLTGTDYLETVDPMTRIRFPQPADTRLEVGDLARVTIILRQAADVLYLPPEALRVYQGRRFVVVQEGDRRIRVDVEVGLQSEDRVQIEHGLREGQLVVAQ